MSRENSGGPSMALKLLESKGTERYSVVLVRFRAIIANRTIWRGKVHRPGRQQIQGTWMAVIYTFLWRRHPNKIILESSHLRRIVFCVMLH